MIVQFNFAISFIYFITGKYLNYVYVEYGVDDVFHLKTLKGAIKIFDHS